MRPWLRGALLRLLLLLPAIALQQAGQRLIVQPYGASLPMFALAAPWIGVFVVAGWQGARAPGWLALPPWALAGALLLTGLDLLVSFTIGAGEERALITEKTGLWLGVSIPLWTALLGLLQAAPLALRRFLFDRLPTR